MTAPLCAVTVLVVKKLSASLASSSKTNAWSILPDIILDEMIQDLQMRNDNSSMSKQANGSSKMAKKDRK
jgi:hypothetical protein